MKNSSMAVAIILATIAGIGHADAVVLTFDDVACHTGPITFRYGSTSGATRVNDIVLDVRAIPEPSTGAMLLLGLSAFGSTFPRRRRR